MITRGSNKGPGNSTAVTPPGDVSKLISRDPSPSDLGQEGMESNIKPNTTGGGETQDRGD